MLTVREQEELNKLDAHIAEHAESLKGTSDAWYPNVALLMGGTVGIIAWSLDFAVTHTIWHNVGTGLQWATLGFGCVVTFAVAGRWMAVKARREMNKHLDFLREDQEKLTRKKYAELN